MPTSGRTPLASPTLAHRPNAAIARSWRSAVLAWMVAAPAVVDTSAWLVGVITGLIGAGAPALLAARNGQRVTTNAIGVRGQRWVAATGAYVAVALVSMAVNHTVAEGAGALLRMLPLAVLSVLVLVTLTAAAQGNAFVGTDVSEARLLIWGGSVLAATASLAVAVQQVTFGPLDRAMGATTNPILFGQFAVLAVLLVQATAPEPDRLGSSSTVLSGVACFAGLTAAALSASRGPLLALLPASLVLALVGRAWIGRRHLVVAGLVCLSAFAAAQLLGGQGLARVEQVAEESIAYSASPPAAPPRATSVGSRLDLWDTALGDAVNAPILGVGWGRFDDGLVERAREHEISWYAATFDHAHNQYLSTFANGGTVGLAALLALFLVPGGAFLARIRGGRAPAPDEPSVVLATAGLVVVVAFAGFALTESVFERVLPVAVYTCLVSVLGHYSGAFGRRPE